MFEQFVKEIISDISQREERQRNRRDDAQHHFEYAIRYILTDLWKASKSIPFRECSINKRAGFYSEQPERYRDSNLTYRQVIAAFEGLLNLRLIEITREGFYDSETLTGELTRYVATDELLEKMNELAGHPAITLKPNFQEEEFVLLRNTIDGQKRLIDYVDTPKTTEYRNNLFKINSEYALHWFDLRIKDVEVSKLAARLERDETTLPIDLSKRFLYRIFTQGSFKKGGRFYRGWWQNVPKEYRPYITIDEGFTSEYDYSQLNPHMLYYSMNKEMGEEDAYSRVLDGEHRDIVKQAFNAMIQADTQLRACPENIDIDKIDISWIDLRERILIAHKPIASLFFQGTGNAMQFEDSQVVENILLQTTDNKTPALPIHDSFIMRQQYASDLEEMMRRAFHSRFGEDIPVSSEIIIEPPRLFEDDGTPRTDEMAAEDREHSQWFDRNVMWMHREI